MPFLRIVLPSTGVRAISRPLHGLEDRGLGRGNLWLADCINAMLWLHRCLIHCIQDTHPGHGGMGEPFKNLAWDDFRLVKTIADAKGLPAAAERLGVTHSAVFPRLRQIEAALGVPLFERHRLGYVATSAGEEMVALADRLDEDITAFTRKVSGRELSPAGELRVTTNDTLLVH